MVQFETKTGMAKEKTTATSDVRNDIVLTPWKTLLTHTICRLGLTVAFHTAHNFDSVNLRLIWVIEAPVVILLYSLFRHHPNQSSEWPVCVTYGGLAGYFVGMVASFGFVLFHNRWGRLKGD